MNAAPWSRLCNRTDTEDNLDRRLPCAAEALAHRAALDHNGCGHSSPCLRAGLVGKHRDHPDGRIWNLDEEGSPCYHSMAPIRMLIYAFFRMEMPTTNMREMDSLAMGLRADQLLLRLLAVHRRR